MLKTLFTHALLPMSLAAALAAPAPARSAEATAPSGAVRVTFEVAQPIGAVMVALYDNEAAYKAHAHPAAATRVEVSGPTATAVFSGLKPGRYAIQSYQDLNGDSQLNHNPMGMPTEPFGFSNNAPPRFGPAAWSDAAFDVGAGETAQRISLK